MKRILAFSALATVVTTMGCINADRINIRFDIDRNLRGTATLEFLGIHSSSEKPEEQEEEMKQFYESGYREQAARIQQEWTLSEAKTEFTNKTALRCDGRITGEIDMLVQSLTPLISESHTSYEIKQDAHRFSFTARGGWTEEDKDLTLIVTYAGKIVEQNAQKFEEASHRMEWNLGQLTDSGIHFVLETE